MLADKYREERKDGSVETALKFCRMRLNMSQFLHRKLDLTTLAEVAEIALEHGEYERAIDKALVGLNHVSQGHAEAVKFFCILMRAKVGLDNVAEADTNFEQA